MRMCAFYYVILLRGHLVKSKHTYKNIIYIARDGPAYIHYYKDGSIWIESYFLNGKKYSKEEYLNLMSPQNRIKVLLNDTE